MKSFHENILNRNSLLLVKLVQLHRVQKYRNIAKSMKKLVPSHMDEFFRAFQIFWCPYCNTSEDLSTDVSISNAGLILTKLRGFQHFGTCQNTS